MFSIIIFISQFANGCFVVGSYKHLAVSKANHFPSESLHTRRISPEISRYPLGTRYGSSNTSTSYDMFSSSNSSDSMEYGEPNCTIDLRIETKKSKDRIMDLMNINNNCQNSEQENSSQLTTVDYGKKLPVLTAVASPGVENFHHQNTKSVSQCEPVDGATRHRQIKFDHSIASIISHET